MDEDKVSRLKGLAELHESGVLSKREFEEQKAKIMQAPSAPGYPQQSPYPQQPPQQPYGGGQQQYAGQQYAGQGDPPMGDGMKTLLYIVSFLFPIVGVIIGVIYNSKPEPWHKEFGKTCLQVAVISIVIGCLCYFIVIAGAMSTY